MARQRHEADATSIHHIGPVPEPVLGGRSDAPLPWLPIPGDGKVKGAAVTVKVEAGRSTWAGYEGMKGWAESFNPLLTGGPT